MHIGDDMDIKKEREAFEEHLAGMNIHNLRVGTIFDTEKNEYFASDVLHPSEDHIVGWINFSWKLWQAKATPEGFVLVPKEPTPKMIDATWNFDEKIQDMSHNSRNEFIYNTMIAAAQEPTND